MSEVIWSELERRLRSAPLSRKEVGRQARIDASTLTSWMTRGCPILGKIERMAEVLGCRLVLQEIDQSDHGTEQMAGHGLHGEHG